MHARFSSYLESLKASVRFDPVRRNIVLGELRAHLEDKWAEMRKQGLTDEAATEGAVKSLGSPRVVAEQLLEVYSRGTWRQAIFAALPHLIVAWLLAVRAWQGVNLLSGALLSATIVLVVATVIYGWWMGKPTWLFPWLGYYLLPVILAGVLVVTLPVSLNWVVGLVYIPLALAALFYIIRQTLREDWLLASLMLMPVPIVVSWLFMLGTGGNDPDWFQWRLYHEAPRISLCFLALAVTSATFVRVKQRRVKIAALLTPEVVILILLAVTTENSLGFLGWLVMTVGSLGFLLTPAWLEGRPSRFLRTTRAVWQRYNPRRT